MPIEPESIFIPDSFLKGEPIEQIILISDVDGVVRNSTEAPVDPRIIAAVKSLVENKQVNITFISGTPIENNPKLEPWRRGNVSLKKAFGSSFEKELLEDKVAIYGVFGSHKMRADGTLEIVKEYSPEISREIGALLIQAFLKEISAYGTDTQKKIAQNLQQELKVLTFKESCPSNETSHEFQYFAEMIREHFDPNFRLISNGALIETHTSNPPWSTSLSSKWLKEELNSSRHSISRLTPTEKQTFAGVAKREDGEFNFLLVSKTDKGLLAKKLIEEKMKLYPQALVVTIGDTQVDFPMHQYAHIAFHVGLEKVWNNNPLSHCIMIRGQGGEDNQHVEGTLKILTFLKESLGQSFYNLKYIPYRDSSGQWGYCSVTDYTKKTS